MTTDRKYPDVTTELAVLSFVVHKLVVAHCEREEDPLLFAQELLSQIEKAFAAESTDEHWQTEIQDQTKVFFSQVVSELKSKTSHHDA